MDASPKIAYVEFYVANSLQSAHFYKHVMGFSINNVSTIKKENLPARSYLLSQGSINLIFTSALHHSNTIAQEVNLHGDGVKDIAFYVDDVSKAFMQALSKNAKPVLEPTTVSDAFGKYEKATVSAFGDTTHSFIKLTPQMKLVFNEKPIFKKTKKMTHIDHIAIVLEVGGLKKLVAFYQDIFGYEVTYKQVVDTTDNGGMNSVVVSSPCKSVQLTLIEPEKENDKSQINDFISAYQGPGVQHIAFATTDIANCVTKLRNKGLEFLKIPGSYYQELKESLSISESEIEIYKKNQILIDRENSGFLLQIFSKPLHPRRTFFIELIERHQSYGFGSRNVIALFQAIAQEQVGLSSA